MKLENPCFWSYIKLVGSEKCGSSSHALNQRAVYTRMLRSEVTLNQVGTWARHSFQHAGNSKKLTSSPLFPEGFEEVESPFRIHRDQITTFSLGKVRLMF